MKRGASCITKHLCEHTDWTADSQRCIPHEHTLADRHTCCMVLCTERHLTSDIVHHVHVLHTERFERT